MCKPAATDTMKVALLTLPEASGTFCSEPVWYTTLMHLWEWFFCVQLKVNICFTFHRCVFSGSRWLNEFAEAANVVTVDKCCTWYSFSLSFSHYYVIKRENKIIFKTMYDLNLQVQIQSFLLNSTSMLNHFLQCNSIIHSYEVYRTYKCIGICKCIVQNHKWHCVYNITRP